MNQLLSIQDGVIKISDVALTNVTGAVLHSGSYFLSGNATITGELSVETLNVKYLNAENAPAASTSGPAGQWTVNAEDELNGKGFSWTWGGASTQLMYRTGNKLWTNAKIDLSPDSYYSIDSIPVITKNALGSGVTTSNLTKVGTLSALAVSGNANLGDFAFFNTNFNRLGINTEQPNAAISIVENNVEIGIGSPATSYATIGTYSNHALGIVTDNIARINIRNSGEVDIGDPVTGNGVLNVYGKLFATSVETDNRIERSHPLQFRANKDSSVFGLGLNWIGTGATRQFQMMDGPERLYSSEDLDLANGRVYSINKKPVLGDTYLGEGVLTSSLTRVGVLDSLSVSGGTHLSLLNTPAINLNDTLAITDAGLSSTSTITLKSKDASVLSGDEEQITIGDKQLQRKPVKVFGPLSVNINNPDPTVSFSVAGDVSIGNKRFTNSPLMPTAGNYEVGDICWNSKPIHGDYIGWVCISAGSPGQWAPFGLIA